MYPVLWLKNLRTGFLSFIYTIYCYIVLSTYPPALNEQFFSPVYMVFQSIRCTAPDVTTLTGRLLPHLFTLTTPRRGGYFLLHYYTLTGIFPLGSMVLFIVRTFLHALRRSDRTVCCVVKISDKMRKLIKKRNSLNIQEFQHSVIRKLPAIS